MDRRRFWTSLFIKLRRALPTFHPSVLVSQFAVHPVPILTKAEGSCLTSFRPREDAKAFNPDSLASTWRQISKRHHPVHFHGKLRDLLWRDPSRFQPLEIVIRDPTGPAA